MGVSFIFNSPTHSQNAILCVEYLQHMPMILLSRLRDSFSLCYSTPQQQDNPDRVPFLLQTEIRINIYSPSVLSHHRPTVYSGILLTPDTWRINRRPHRHHPARGLRRSNKSRGTTAVHRQSICTIPTGERVHPRCRHSPWDSYRLAVRRARANYPHCTTLQVAAAAQQVVGLNGLSGNWIRHIRNRPPLEITTPLSQQQPQEKDTRTGSTRITRAA